MIYRPGHTLIIIIVIYLTCPELKAQSFNQDYNFKHLTVQNGLAQNIVYHFLQDSRGYIWIGTHHGLTLFDGIRTINFLKNERDNKSVSGNFISAILEDSSGQIWIGNENGINLYNRFDHSFSHFAVDRPGGKKDTTYCVPLGFVTSTELWFLDTKTKAVRSLDTKANSTSFIADLDANNAVFYKNPGSQNVNIWTSYAKGSTHQVFRGGKLFSQKVFFSENKDRQGIVLDVSHVLQQNDTTAWLSTNEGLVMLNPVTGKYELFNKWGNEAVTEVRYSSISTTGELWAATGPAGVYLFDIKIKQFTGSLRNNKSDPFSICSNNIVSLYFDKMGNAWCGSYGDGVSYTNTGNNFFKKHISKIDPQAMENDNKIAWMGYGPDGNLWCLFANKGGIWIIDKKFNIITQKYPLLQNGSRFRDFTNLLIFDNDDNKVWYATNKGLFVYDIHANRLSPVKYPLISDELMGSSWINHMIRLRDNSILLATFGGLYRVTNEKGNPNAKPFSVLNQEEYIGFRRLFQDPDGYVYVKSMGDRFYILKPTAQGDYELIKKMHFYPEVNHYFYDSAEKTTYLATSDGLYHIDNKKFQIEKKSFASKTISSSNISSILKIDSQYWMFGEKGIYYQDEKNNVSRTFTIEDGLPANQFSLSALIYTPGGSCIAGCSNGLVSFIPDQAQNEIYPPRAQVTNIYINDISDTSIANPNEIKTLDLTYKENTFSFDFTPIAFQHATQCSFEYMLERYDETWIKSGPANYTRYSKIPPGNYVFHLRVLGGMNRISPFIKTLEIHIAEAFWQTPLFKTVAILFILAVGLLLSRWYFNQGIRKQKLVFEKQQDIERERTRIATDMHDDLGAGLSRIKFISQSISNKKIEDESIKTELEKITGYSDEMTEKMGEIVWALNEKNDTLADLVAYSRSYAIEYLANHHIACKANTPLGLPGTFIAGEIRRNIFLSVKECLHNIVKHANATCVNFSVELGHMIRITIHDNGKGIDWSNQRAFSNGIQNIRQRMKDIKGEVEFYNENGTKVVLIIPL